MKIAMSGHPHNVRPYLQLHFRDEIERVVRYSIKYRTILGESVRIIRDPELFPHGTVPRELICISNPSRQFIQKGAVTFGETEKVQRKPLKIEKTSPFTVDFDN